MLRRTLSLLVLAGASSAAFAQTNSNAPTVTLNATLAETLTIAATPSNVNFTLAAGSSATGSAPVAITTTWVLGANRSSVKLFGWFTTPSAALTDGASTPNNIPSSNVLGQVTSGTPTSYTAFSSTGTALGVSGGSLELFNQAITNANRSANRSDNLNIKIDLTSQPQLPAGTYTGTLTLQAQAL